MVLSGSRSVLVVLCCSHCSRRFSVVVIGSKWF